MVTLIFGESQENTESRDLLYFQMISPHFNDLSPPIDTKLVGREREGQGAG